MAVSRQTSEQTPLYENRVGPCAPPERRWGSLWREKHDVDDSKIGMPPAGANLPREKANLPTCTSVVVVEAASTSPAMASKNDRITDGDVSLDIFVETCRIVPAIDRAAYAQSLTSTHRA